MTIRAGRRTAAWLSVPLVLAACNPATSSPSASASSAPSAAEVPSASIGEVVPAPDSSSTIYRPNPGAIVVAIDPGHGGCLDWGVPDPLGRGQEVSEKTMTLGIGLELKRLLEAQGITVVMTRQTDVALAGDVDPAHGCHGAPFRDVNGDGESGFDPEGKIRTHDELQARLDLVNLARADLLVSIHINSSDVAFAATQTYWTDETAWGATATRRLAQLVQDGVLAAMGPVASYDRQDRGISAVNFFIVAPPLFETTPERPDPRKQPTRGALLPAILTEVGYITLPEEQDLLLSPVGQAAAAKGIADGLASYVDDRQLAVRYDALIPLGAAGTVTDPVGGSGPPYWATGLRRAEWALGLPLRLTNTGSASWPQGLRLLGGWEAANDQPYLRRAPAALNDLAIEVPPLAPGESVQVVVRMSLPVVEGGLVWITLSEGSVPLSDLGSPPLQLTTSGP